MFKYKSMTLDCMGYHNVVVPLDKVGTTIVKGRNLNASLSGRANGAGKTLLVSPIQHFKYNTKQKSLFSTGSSIRLDVEVDGHEYSFIKSMPKSSVKYDIIKDGTNVEARTSSIAENLIHDILPQTEEEFYAFTYLDSRRPNDLQFGTPTARLNFFSNIFRLEDFDIVRTKISERIKELSHKTSERSVYASQLSEIQLADIDIDDIKSKIFAAKKTIKKYEKWQLEKTRQSFYKNTVSKYKHLEHYNGAEDTHVQILADAFNVKRHNDRAKQHNANVKKNAVRYEQWQAHEKKLQSVFDTKLKGKALQKHCAEVQRKAEQAYDTYLDSVDQRDALLKDKKRADKIVIKKDIDFNVVTAQLEEAVSKLDDLKLNKGKSVCSYCGSKIDTKHFKKHVSELEQQIKALQKSRDVARETARLKREKENLWNEHKAKSLKSLKKIKKVSKPSKIDIYKYDVIDKPEKLMKLKPEIDTSKSEDIKTWISVKADYLKAKDSIKDIGAKPKVKSAKKVVEKYGKQVNDYEHNVARTKDLEQKISALDKELEDLPLYEALLVAYSNKGIKLSVMKQLAARIEANMNEYAHLLFPEKFKFSLDVDLNKFDIMATRSKRTSDIRFLSGAESRSFSLLFMIACLPLIPRNRRSNLIVLDEFEAGLDKPTRELLVDKFLPALNKIVPHIIFITPNDIGADKSVNRTTLTVVKSKDTTYIEEQ